MTIFVVTFFLLTLNQTFMSKFITVTDGKGLSYSFNVSHIICVLKDAHGAIIKHSSWGSNCSSLTVRESYEYVMEMIKS